MNRVTVDLDYPSLFEIVRSWHYLEGIGHGVRGRLSSSGEGVHLRADGVPGDEIQEHHRIMAGDDIKRVDLDMDRDYRPPQALFDYKHGQEAGPWVCRLDNLLEDYRQSTGITA